MISLNQFSWDHLQALVMLTSNVGYLAIQSLDIDVGTARSPGQIACYLSAVANIGSIILGLLLLRHNRTKRAETAADFVSQLLATITAFYLPHLILSASIFDSCKWSLSRIRSSRHSV